MTIILKDGVLNKKHLGDILGSFSKATGLHTEAVDTEGETFFTPKGIEGSDFCKFIRSQPGREKMCQEFYKRASSEAAKWEEPYFFRCHAGLVIWAVPIIVNGTTLGSIICGQVLMWKPDDFFWKEIRMLNSEVKNFFELKKRAIELEIVSPDRTQAAADMLLVAVNHMVRRNIYELEKQEDFRIRQQQLRKGLEERKKLSSLEVNNYDQYFKKERKLLSCIRVGDKTRADEILKSLLIDLFTRTVGEKQIIKVRITELATLVSRAAVEGGADADRAMIRLKNFHDEIAQIDKVEEYLYKGQITVEKFMEDIFALADKKYFSLMKEARNFIMESYSKPIKVEDIAEHLFISPSHLSRLFRQEMDCTVNDFLTKVRIEKATELMKKPELTVEQVAKAVGFKNQSYFAKIFRKYTGVTPLVYRNSLF